MLEHYKILNISYCLYVIYVYCLYISTIMYEICTCMCMVHFAYTLVRVHTLPTHTHTHTRASSYIEKTRFHFRFGTFHHKFNRSCSDLGQEIRQDSLEIGSEKSCDSHVYCNQRWIADSSLHKYR